MHTTSSAKAPARKQGGEATLRIMFDNTNEHAICMLDTAGTVLTWNMSAERLLGYPSDEVLGRDYALLFPLDEAQNGIPRRAITTTMRTGRFIAEGARQRKDGTLFWGRSFFTRVRETRSHPAFIVLITHDISAGRALEQKRDEYIGIASHELKTPITTLSLYSELLAKRLLLGHDKQNLRMMRDIQGQAARLVALVDDLLIVTKIESGSLMLHKESFDIQTLIRRVLQDLRGTTSKHTVTLKGTAKLLVNADKSRIAQVVSNLLTNAVRYSPHGSTIVIRTRREDGSCIVSIQDHGQGILKSHQRDIFTRFYRTDSAQASHPAGSGLGLYISKQIIKKHGERLWVASSPGSGSTFSFTLSLA
jgi:PAS domain S-box-containing protein